MYNADVKKYIDENNLKIKWISPILRGGRVQAIKLSHSFYLSMGKC